MSQEDKPFTRRGILSTVNSLFDPIGFAAELISAELSMKKVMSTEVDEVHTFLE